MASIRKITYERKNKKLSTYWQLTYYDSKGDRQRKNYKSQAKANAERIRVEGELQTGAHITDKNSVTVSAATLAFEKDFEDLVKAGKREHSSLRQYKTHFRNHIRPSTISEELLSTLQPKHCQELAKSLESGLTSATAAKVMVSFRALMRFSQLKGWINTNPASAVVIRRETRNTRSLNIPEIATVKKLLTVAKKLGAEEHAFLAVGFFTGLRASELRGLPWSAIDLDKAVLRVVQRADERGRIGRPKTVKSAREVPLGAYTLAALKEWKKQATESLVFGSEVDTPKSLGNLRNRFWNPLFLTAKVEPVFGFHVMRHVCASLWIAEGLTIKQVQTRLGHTTIKMTMDTYGHLWPNEDDHKLSSGAERRVFATKKTQKRNKPLIKAVS